MRRASISLSLAACLFSGSTAFAQVANVISIGREVIKEGRTAAHERVEAEWARAERRIKSPAYYVALNSGSASEVWFVSGYASFKTMDESTEYMEKAPIKAEMDQLDARDGVQPWAKSVSRPIRMRMVVSIQTFSLPDLHAIGGDSSGRDGTRRSCCENWPATQDVCSGLTSPVGS